MNGENRVKSVRLLLAGQFCHGHAGGPWIAVTWWALYWNGPIRETFPMVCSQLPAWNDTREKAPWFWKTIREHWLIVKQFAVFGRKQLSNVAWVFCPESSTTAGSFFAVFGPNRPTIQGKLIASDSFAKTSVAHGLCFFRAKTLVLRGMFFSCPNLCLYKFFTVLFRHLCRRLLSKRVIALLSVLNVSLSLLSRSPWLGTP